MSEINKEKITNSWIAWVSLIITSFAFAGWAYDHFSDNNPNLTFTVIKEISLLNNKANIPSIHISLDSIDISETNSNLSIYTIKVENEGKQHITKDMYDGNIQLRLNRGEYISLPSITYVSSEHIKPHFEDITLISEKCSLRIPCIPMDKNDVYLFDVILRHPIDTLPTFSVRGKITGQKEISVVQEIKDHPSFWKTAFGGGFLVNIARTAGYFILGLAILISIIMLVDKITTFFQKVKLQKAIRNIISSHPINSQVADDFSILEESDLRIMYKWINTTDEEATKNYNRIRKKRTSKSKGINRYIYMEERRLVSAMIQKKYLNLLNGEIMINKSMKDDFMYVYKQLKEQKILNIDRMLL